LHTNFHPTFRRFASLCGGAVLAVAIASTASGTAFAQTPATGATPAETSSAKPWVINGLFDAYYLYDGNFPKGVGSSQVTGFDYNERASTPTLSLAELNISKPVPTRGGFGFKTTLLAGDTATDIAPSGEEKRYQNIGQLYISYVGKSGAGIDIGKFYTPFGYEVVESNQNYNYSRSFIFTDLLPTYHSGLRVYSRSYNGLIASAYLVKAINNIDLGGSDEEGVHDANKSLGYIGQLNYQSRSGKVDAVETYGGSHDGQNGYQDRVLLSDTDLTFLPDDDDTYGLNYTNRQDKYDIGPGARYNGYAGYYRRQLTQPYAMAFRVEKIFTRIGSVSSNADSFTATFEDKAARNILLRLEGRHDDASIAPFLTGTSNVLGKTQNTLTVSGVYTFGS
jgi:hypothetical protein